MHVIETIHILNQTFGNITIRHRVIVKTATWNWYQSHSGVLNWKTGGPPWPQENQKPVRSCQVRMHHTYHYLKPHLKTVENELTPNETQWAEPMGDVTPFACGSPTYTGHGGLGSPLGRQAWEGLGHFPKYCLRSKGCSSAVTLTKMIIYVWYSIPIHT